MRATGFGSGEWDDVFISTPGNMSQQTHGCPHIEQQLVDIHKHTRILKGKVNGRKQVRLYCDCTLNYFRYYDSYNSVHIRTGINQFWKYCTSK